jgi:predicted transcriptional regulator
MMEMPHEIIVWYVLPALRRGLVIELKQLKMAQKDIARSMRVTEAAVSQYMHNKRGSKEIKFSRKLSKEIKKSALRIKNSKNKDTLMKELIRLVKLSSKERIVCRRCVMKNGRCNICNLQY